MAKTMFVWRDAYFCVPHNLCGFAKYAAVNGVLFPFLLGLSVKSSALLHGQPLLRLLAGSGFCLAC